MVTDLYAPFISSKQNKFQIDWASRDAEKEAGCGRGRNN